MGTDATLDELRTMAEAEHLDGEWSAETANERCARYGELIEAMDRDYNVPGED